MTAGNKAHRRIRLAGLTDDGRLPGRAPARTAERLHVCAGAPPKRSLVAMGDMALAPEGPILDDIAPAILPDGAWRRSRTG